MLLLLGLPVLLLGGVRLLKLLLLVLLLLLELPVVLLLLRLLRGRGRRDHGGEEAAAVVVRRARAAEAAEVAPRGYGRVGGGAEAVLVPRPAGGLACKVRAQEARHVRVASTEGSVAMRPR